MTQIIIIQPGDTARLTFFGGELDREWYNGLACMPNVFHTTIVMFKFAILWGLAVLRNDKYKRYEEPTVHVDVSDSNFRYNANVEMTYTQAQLNRGIGIILKLFCDYKRVPEEYYVASFGYRVLMVGIIMVCLSSSATLMQKKLAETTLTVPQISQPAITPPPTGATGEPKREIQAVPQTLSALDAGRYPRPTYGKDFVPFVENGLRYNLIEGPMPTHVPPLQWFTEKRGGGIGRMSDGITYYALAGGNEDEPLRWFYLSGGQACLTVEPGAVGVIESSQPPKVVLNMSDEVLVGVYVGKSGHRERLAYDPPNGYWGDSAPWKRLHDFWGKAMYSFGRDNDITKMRAVPFFVRGLSKDQSLPGRVPVGLVCF